MADIAIITREDFALMLQSVCTSIIKNEPMLTEIDLKIGDGDHGIGMKRGFTALQNWLKDDRGALDIKQFTREVGLVLLEHMGGASGVLFGSLFISGSKVVPEGTAVTPSVFAAMLLEGTDAIMRRGKANLGDKTMIDALLPAAQKAEQVAKRKAGFTKMFDAAQKAAWNGVENTKQMEAKMGRARAFRDFAIGYQDAGATSVFLIFEACYLWCCEASGLQQEDRNGNDF